MFYPTALPELTPSIAIVYEAPSTQDLTLQLDHRAPLVREASGTSFVELASRLPAFERPSARTRASSDVETGAGRASERDLAELSMPDEATRAREERIALLARRHTGAGSIEDDARFRILTERLRRLVPRVTSADFQPVEAALSAMETTTATLDELRAKFGVR